MFQTGFLVRQVKANCAKVVVKLICNDSRVLESTPSTFRAEGDSRLEFVGKTDRIIFHVLRTLPLLLAKSAPKTSFFESALIFVHVFE